MALFFDFIAYLFPLFNRQNFFSQSVLEFLLKTSLFQALPCFQSSQFFGRLFSWLPILLLFLGLPFFHNIIIFYIFFRHLFFETLPFQVVFLYHIFSKLLFLNRFFFFENTFPKSFFYFSYRKSQFFYLLCVLFS